MTARTTPAQRAPTKRELRADKRRWFQRVLSRAHAVDALEREVAELRTKAAAFDDLDAAWAAYCEDSDSDTWGDAAERVFVRERERALAKGGGDGK